MSDLITAQDAAKLLRVDKQTVYRWAREGRIPCVRPGGRVMRFHKQQLATWLALSSTGKSNTAA